MITTEQNVLNANIPNLKLKVRRSSDEDSFYYDINEEKKT